MQLKNQIAIVTGASEGIGKAIALALAEAGASLVLAARTPEKLTASADEIRSRAGSRVLEVAADLSRSADANLLAKRAIEEFGQVDILVNNVGRGLRKSFVETSDEDWQWLVATNLSTVVYGCRAVLPYMLAQGCGKIINIASRSGRVGEANLAAYCAVKHGVIGLTRALAEEVGPRGIHVNVICPGGVRTERMERILPQVDKSGWLTPEDVAAAVLFLTTSPGRTMQGQALDMF